MRRRLGTRVIAVVFFKIPTFSGWPAATHAGPRFWYAEIPMPALLGRASLGASGGLSIWGGQRVATDGGWGHGLWRPDLGGGCRRRRRHRRVLLAGAGWLPDTGAADMACMTRTQRSLEDADRHVGLSARAEWTWHGRHGFFFSSAADRVTRPLARRREISAPTATAATTTRLLSNAIAMHLPARIVHQKSPRPRLHSFQACKPAKPTPKTARPCPKWDRGGTHPAKPSAPQLETTLLCTAHVRRSQPQSTMCVGVGVAVWGAVVRAHTHFH